MKQTPNPLFFERWTWIWTQINQTKLGSCKTKESRKSFKKRNNGGASYCIKQQQITTQNSISSYKGKNHTETYLFGALFRPSWLQVLFSHFLLKNLQISLFPLIFGVVSAPGILGRWLMKRKWRFAMWFVIFEIKNEWRKVRVLFYLIFLNLCLWSF
jgi:hypothetical protein